MIRYLIAGIITVSALIFPMELSVPIFVNSNLWFFLILLSAFFGISLLYVNINIWIKIIAIFSFVSCFFSKAPYLSFTAYILLVASIYFYLLCLRLTDYKVILNAIQNVFFINIILIVMQSFGFDNLMNFSRGPVCFGIIGNSMRFSSLLVIMAPFLLINSRLNIVPMFLIAVLSKSCGMPLMLGAGVLVYLLFMVRNKLPKMIIALSFIILILFVYHTDDSLKHFGTDRKVVWKKTVELSNERPLKGYGLGTYKVLFPVLGGDIQQEYTVGGYEWEYEGTKGNWMAWRSAHNTFLQILFEMGYVGLLLFLGLIGYLIYLFLRAAKGENSIRVFSGLVVILASMLYYFPDRMIQSVPILICFMAVYENHMRGKYECDFGG